jgi:uroporphyrinogen decarboxylase
MEIFSKDGGYVFATVHNAQADVPVENFIAMWEAFKECRNY